MGYSTVLLKSEPTYFVEIKQFLGNTYKIVDFFVEFLIFKTLCTCFETLCKGKRRGWSRGREGGLEGRQKGALRRRRRAQAGQRQAV